MKLIEMRCPNCDAPLSVNSDRDEAFCQHCNTTFLIEGAPEPRAKGNRGDAGGMQAAEKAKPDKPQAEAAVEFEKAKAEPPATERFAGAIAATLKAKADAFSAKQKAKWTHPGRAADDGRTLPRKSPSRDSAARRRVGIAAGSIVAALFAVTMIAVAALDGRVSAPGASSGAHEMSSSAVSGGASKAAASSPSATSSVAASSPSAEADEPDDEPDEWDEEDDEELADAASGSTRTGKAQDGFPCNLDSTATFSGVTIPIDSTWKDNSPEWDWRHETFSYTAGSSSLEDVQVSISTFIGGDTKNAVPFMEDYADFGPIFLNSGEYTVKHVEQRDGVTYTRIEGVDSHYTSSFEYNPPPKHASIREMHENETVRCVCLVGYAEDGTGFAAAVALHSFADNDECLRSANKILDGVTFDPAECKVDSTDRWLYEVEH